MREWGSRKGIYSSHVDVYTGIRDALLLPIELNVTRTCDA